MKVKYMGEDSVSLTNNKIYDVVAIEEDWYRIVDNTEEDYLFNPDEFEVVEEQQEPTR